MIRKLIATAALAATATLGLAGTATAAPRHSDFYVSTFGHGWVAEDQLTVDELTDLAAVCQPVKYAVKIAFPTTYTEGTSLIATPGGWLVPEGAATLAHVNTANSNQVGLAVPSFIGPDHYSVVGYNSDGSPFYGC